MMYVSIERRYFMGRRKGSLNKKTLERMGLDKYKINHQNDGKKAQNHPQNDGKPKRVRRTKAELIAAGYYDKYHQNKGKKPKIEELIAQAQVAASEV